MRRVLVPFALERVDPKGRALPSPLMWHECISVAQKVLEASKAAGQDEAVVLARINGAIAELSEVKGSVSGARSTRQDLRASAREETRSEVYSCRLRPGTYDMLQARAEKEDISMSSLLWAEGFKAIQEREQLENIESMLAGWVEEADRLTEEDLGDSGFQEKLQALAMRIITTSEERL